MRKEMLFTAASLLLVLGAAVAYGADKETFVKKATESGDFEVTSSELAQDKSQSADVKEFAAMMIKDHTEAAQKLEKVSTEAGIKPENKGVGQKTAHTADLEKLQNAEGGEFDAAYIAIQQTAHEEAVKLFSDYSKDGDDPKLKQFASDTLPTLQMHLEHASKLAVKK
jgi:putative membrane protein